MELQTFVYAAILIEGVVNLIKTVKDGSTSWKYWASFVAAVVLSLVVALNWNLDLFSKVLGDGELPYVGMVLTAFLFARGSNYLADLVKLVKAVKVRNGG